MTQQIIVKTLFGSKLYGTSTPESDTDYKTVFIPDRKTLLLHGPMVYADNGTADSSRKNTKDDVDDKMYSLAKFMEQGKTQDFMFMDMLFTPSSRQLTYSQAWDHLRKHRNEFIVKDIEPFRQYVRKQVNKYGFKGSRLNAMIRARLALSAYATSAPGMLLREVFDMPGFLELLQPDEITYVAEVEHKGVFSKYLYVAGKKYQGGNRVSIVLEALKNSIADMSPRMHEAEQGIGVDWKAVSHAFRVCYQIMSLHQIGDIRFPFTGKRKEKIMQVKQGGLTWLEASDELEELMLDVEETVAKSTAPEKISAERIDQLTLEMYEIAGVTW